MTDTPEHLRFMIEKARDLLLVAKQGGRVVGTVLGLRELRREGSLIS